MFARRSEHAWWDKDDYLDAPLPRYQGDATVEIAGEMVDLNAVRSPWEDRQPE